MVSQIPASMQALSVRPVFKRQLDNFDKILKVLTHLFYVLNVIKKTPDQEEEMKQIISYTLRLNPRNSSGDTLLHLVVSKNNVMKSQTFIEDPHTVIFPDADVAELLLSCGAFVEALNNTMSSPLHLASSKSNFNPRVIDVLLSHGAHIDRRNATGHQPHRLLASIPESKINSLQHMTLKCLAARKIVELRIPYTGQIPVSLEDFIKIH